MLVCGTNTFYDMCGNMPSILQSVLLLAYLRYDSNEIYSFVILSYIYYLYCDFVECTIY